MFLGEFFCIFLHAAQEFIEHSKTGRKIQILPRKAPLHYFLLPASLDLVLVGFMNMALTMLAASTHQMLKGGNILITALMARAILKAKVFGFHWISMSIIFTGLFLVGLQDQLNEGGEGTKTNGIGIIMLVIGQIFDGC
jgi:drug/metabolite transporter (DMT)-like permease